MEARSARKEVLLRSSRRFHASRKLGSCGNGHKGWMYVKKSSISKSNVSNGQIDSAESCGLDV